MRSKHVLTSDDARQLVSADRAEAEKNGRPVSIAVAEAAAGVPGPAAPLEVQRQP